jgi:DUF4097 and DUF4098 domain-containing protein YvlB
MMKKVAKWALISGAVMTLVGAGLGLSGWMMGPAYALSWEKGRVVAQYTKTDTKSYAGANVRHLDVQAKDTLVEIKRGNTFKVTTITNTTGKQGAVQTLKDGTLTVKAENSVGSAALSLYTESAKIEITVPTTTNLDGVTVTANNGMIILNDVKTGQTKLTTTNGWVSVSQLAATGLTIKSTNGELSLKTVTADTLQATTVNGMIDVDDLTLQAGGSVSTESGVIRTGNLHVTGLDFEAKVGLVAIKDEEKGHSYESQESDPNTLHVTTTNGSIQAD